MPSRPNPLITDQYYHIFNRSNDRIPIFNNKWVNNHALETINYYRFTNNRFKLSLFLRWEKDRQQQLFKDMEKKNKNIVEILCFCLMPNHYHLLIRQKKKSGISKYLSNFQNSFTRYYNLRHSRSGHLFQGQFKAVRIETDEQLVQVTRYIHLNPYTGFVLKNLDELRDYAWSSLPEYIAKKRSIFCNVNTVLSLFQNRKDYQNFICSEADYQKKLASIKHLIIE